MLIKIGWSSDWAGFPSFRLNRSAVCQSWSGAKMGQLSLGFVVDPHLPRVTTCFHYTSPQKRRNFSNLGQLESSQIYFQLFFSLYKIDESHKCFIHTTSVTEIDMKEQKAHTDWALSVAEHQQSGHCGAITVSILRLRHNHVIESPLPLPWRLIKLQVFGIWGVISLATWQFCWCQWHHVSSGCFKNFPASWATGKHLSVFVLNDSDLQHTIYRKYLETIWY